MKKIVVVGGGLAGLEVVKELSKSDLFEVVLVDKNNYNVFPPLLYQVSTAFIEASSISYPFRKLFQGRRALSFFMGSFLEVAPEIRTIKTDCGYLRYDYLILAMGTETNFFGNEHVIANALPMKSIDEALNLRNHILLRLEEASRSTCRSEKEKLLNLVIAGGGPTGVELAGMLAEMKNNIGWKDYPASLKGHGNIYLVNAGPSLLAPMSGKAQKEAERVLRELNVEILLNTSVTDFQNENVALSTGENIRTATLIWTSGVVARAVKGLPDTVFGKGKRIMVDKANRVTGFENIFAIGDQCLMSSDTDYPEGHPQLAQVALQQAKVVASNLVTIVQGKPVRPFRYSNKGSMAIISKYRAVVDLPAGFFKGSIAWLAWLFVHIIPLISFRNKTKLALSWFWSFMTNDPTLRLIIRPDKNSVSSQGNSAKRD